jgi:uncharacterized protein
MNTMSALGHDSQPEGEWPTETMVTGALADPDWRPLPFQEFILKVHGRCNLSCDYCYMYELADQSWRAKPAVMAADIFDVAVRRIADHVTAHDLRSVTVVFHGGEPLMAGHEYLNRAAASVRRAMPATVSVKLGIQTNGILLTEPVLRVLRAHDVHVGVSVDGGEQAHDRHRRYANGRGSHAAVQRGLAALRRPAYQHLYSGLLCTVDVSNDPILLYEDLLAVGPPRVDFLLPHANWASPPPGYADGQAQTLYADWLIAIFDRWYSQPRREVGVRLFEEIMNLVLGGASASEGIGLSPVRMLVIDTDGSVEQVDSLKSAFEGAPETGLNVRTDPLDIAMCHPAVVARQRGVAALSATCLGCPVHRICGGGNYVHRYRPGAGFLNPSVYCADLRRLIEHIRDTVHADLRRLQEGTRE